ncbi:hypothetical protein J2803_001022 [Paraburkholderia phenoliruptrix]|nr:hypothetical protein [Paraburkholderia phenoliruptrix]
MYLIGEYFVECAANHVPGDKWEAIAYISRADDWRKLARVPKAVFTLSVDYPTKRDAEHAAIQSARDRVLTCSDTIERALKDGCV